MSKKSKVKVREAILHYFKEDLDILQKDFKVEKDKQTIKSLRSMICKTKKWIKYLEQTKE